MLPLKVDVILRPRRDQQLLSLFHLGRSQRRVGAEADVLEGVVIGAFGGSHHQTAFTQIVQQRGLHGDPHRIVQRQAR